MDQQSTYAMAVFVHLLLFVVWLGGDIGVFLLGQHFRKREVYSLDQRVALLKLLVIVDLAPRLAWALMVPVSLTVLQLGHWWELGWPSVAAAWIAGLWWSWFVLASHARGTTAPAMAANKRFETFFKLLMIIFYLWLGVQSWLTGAPLAPHWLATKAIMFALIFLAAVMIDVQFKPVGGLLTKLLAEGSSDSTEQPLRAAMDRTRRWVLLIYLLLLSTAFLGNVKPF